MISAWRAASELCLAAVGTQKRGASQDQALSLFIFFHQAVALSRTHLIHSTLSQTRYKSREVLKVYV